MRETEKIISAVMRDLASLMERQAVGFATSTINFIGFMSDEDEQLYGDEVLPEELATAYRRVALAIRAYLGENA